jgi:hypothetical protein
MMRRSWFASATGLGALLAVGCGGPLPFEGTTADLQVEVESLTATVQGSPMNAARVVESVGLRTHDTGQFFLRAEDGSTMTVTVCPLGELQLNPYGGGDPGTGTPVPADAGVPFDVSPREDFERREPGFASHCEEPSVSVCTDGKCMDLAHGEVQARVIEQAGWRQILVDGAGDDGSVALDLRYRELR